MTRFLLNRKTSSLMLFLGIGLFGTISLYKIPRQLFPSIEKPSFVVITSYKYTSAEEVENLISRPIEESLSSVSGVQDLISESHQNVSIIQVKLNWGTDLSQAVIDARQKIDMNLNRLPEDASSPIILKIDPGQIPVLTMVVHSPMHQLYFRDTFEKEIRPLLERISGVSAVTISGGQKKEIRIVSNITKLLSLHLSITDISNAIKNFNFDFPIGYAEEGNKELFIKYSGRFLELKDIEQLPVRASKEGSLLKISDIGTVEEGPKRNTGYSLHNGEETILINFYKEQDANDIVVADNINTQIKNVEKRFGSKYTFSLIKDNTVFINESIRSVITAASLGAIIAFIVMLLINGDLLASIIVITTIPTSVLLTFIFMNFFDISLNMMSLGGLALGVGMIIDSSIVMVESIQTELENQPLSIEAIMKGVNNVSSSVIASTLTSIAVFLPVVFMEGLSAAIFSDLALTISFSLLSSLFCSFTLTPLLFLSPLSKSSTLEATSKILYFFLQKPIHITMQTISLIENKYENAFYILYKNKGVTLLIVSGISLIGVAGFIPLRKELFSKTSNNAVEIRLNLLPGITESRSKEIMKAIHHSILKIDGVKNIITKSGFEPDDPRDLIDGTRGFDKTVTTVNFDKKMTVDSQNIEKISAITKSIISKESSADLAPSILESSIGQTSYNIDIIITGNDRSQIRIIGNDLTELLLQKENEYKYKVSRSTINDNQDVWVIKLNKEKASLNGVSGESILDAIAAGSLGQSAGQYYKNDQTFDIRAFSLKDGLRNINDVNKLAVSTEDGNIMISELIGIQKENRYTKLLKINQLQTEKISISPPAGMDLERLTHIIKNILPKNFSENTEVIVERSDSNLLKSLVYILYSFILSFILIYQILASQFESITEPLLLIFSVPVMLLGVVFGLFVTGNSFNINSGIGLIMLIGIVVNNSILIFEKIEQLRMENPFKPLNEIAILAGKSRLRPVIIASSTTVMGMLPLALEGSSGYQTSLAVTVIGGLTVSTLITVLVYPILYVIKNKT